MKVFQNIPRKIQTSITFLIGLIKNLNSSLLEKIPLAQETVSILTYKSMIEYFVINRPDEPNVNKAATLREEIKSKGYLITQVFLNEDNEVICRPDGSPYGRKFFAKTLDEELSDAFGNKNVIVIE